MRKINARIIAIGCLLLPMAGFAQAAYAQCSTNSNCQIILSGTALPATPNPPCTPWGLWLWSQPNNNNAYGNEGDGSIYFYGIAPAEAHVDVSNVSLTDNNSVSESASGTFPNGTTVNCTFTAHQTSPGKGILDTMACTLVSKSGTTTNSCAAPAGGVPITLDISNATK
jgi:hypothetical protein